MAAFFSLVNVSEPVRRALEVPKQEINGRLAELSTKEQAEFWTELHAHALVRTRDNGLRQPLIAAPQIDGAVRRALELIDEHIHAHTAELSAADEQRFWEVLHEQAQRIAEESATAHGGHRMRFH